MRFAGLTSALPTVWTNVVAAFVLIGAALDPRMLVPLIVTFSLVHLAGRAAWPVAGTVARVLVYVTTACVVPGTLSKQVLIGVLCAGAYYLGVALHERRAGASLSLVLLFVPLAATVALVRDVAGVVVWLGFLTWTIRQVASIIEGGRATAGLVAGIALLDATLIAHAGRPYLAAVTATAFAATVALQRVALARSAVETTEGRRSTLA